MVNRKRKASKLTLVQKIIVASTLMLIIGVTTIAGTIVVERMDRRVASPKPQSFQAISEARARAAEEAEASATWETYHCELMHRYYAGPEPRPPIAELIGLSAQASGSEVEKRCNALLPAVRSMGGWPSDSLAQDNFIVCDGFEWTIDFEGNELRVRPDPDSRTSSSVLFSLNHGPFQQQTLTGTAPSTIGGLTTPMVTIADDTCIVVSAQRSGRRRGIPGNIVRVGG